MPEAEERPTDGNLSQQVEEQLIDRNSLPISQDAGTTSFSVEERKEAGYKRNCQPRNKQQSTTKS